eukprot:GEMP01011751.1.p1 GENE.GEMP01011751.1~~GEMP01011751.1.p1  ORF type:complete len:947 (+),score=242.01 GEMP01011751.1:143-2983(+)
MGDAVSSEQASEFATSTFYPGTMDLPPDAEQEAYSGQEVTSGPGAPQMVLQPLRHPLQPVLSSATAPKDMKSTMSAAALENSLVTQFVTLLGSRQKQSLLLSDLGALMNARLRTAIKEKGGLRTWVQRYPEHFVITGQPGKEHVSLIVPGTEREKENDPPEGKNSMDVENERSASSRSSDENVAANGTNHANGKDAASHDSNGCERSRSAEKVGKKKGRGSAAEDADAESRQEQDLEEEDAALFELHPILQLRGLPYHAQMEDILSFLGFARVHFLTADSARECRDDLHMRRMDQRYVEIFLYNDRLSRRRKEEKLFGAHDGGDRDKNSNGVEPNTPEEVLRECMAYLKQQGKDVLLSMLGVALSPQSREYLKQDDQGLKQFLARYPELSVEGTKGCECVCLASDSKLLGAHYEESSNQQPNAANDVLHGTPVGSPVVGAPTTPPAAQQSQALTTYSVSTLSVSHLHHESQDNSRAGSGGVPFQPRLDELLTPPAAHVTSADYSHLMQHILPPHHPLGFPQHPVGMQYPHVQQTSFALYPQLRAGPQPVIPSQHHFHTHHHHHHHRHAQQHLAHNGPMEGPHAAHSPAHAAHIATPLRAHTAISAPRLERKPFAHMFPPTAASGCHVVEDNSSRGLQLGSPRYDSTPSDWGTPMDSDGTAGDHGWTVHDPWGLTKKALASCAASDDVAHRSLPSTMTMHTMDELSVDTGARCPPSATTDEGCTVRLRGLPYTSGEQDILSFFSRHNVVDRVASVDGAVKVEMKPNGRPSGTAIVKLNHPDDMNAVKVALNDRWIEKRYIEVFTESEYKNANSLVCPKTCPENSPLRPDTLARHSIFSGHYEEQCATITHNEASAQFVGNPYAYYMEDIDAQQPQYSNYSVEQPFVSAHFSHMTVTPLWNQSNVHYAYTNGGDANGFGLEIYDNRKPAGAVVAGSLHISSLHDTTFQ